MIYIVAIILIVFILFYSYRILLYGLIFQPEFYSITNWPDLQLFQSHFEQLRHEVIEKAIPHISSSDMKEGKYLRIADTKKISNLNGWINGWKTDDKSWLVYPLIKEGIEFTNNTKNVPTIREILSVIGINKINAAGLALLKPNSYLEPHVDCTGPKYGSMTYHLGIVVPPNLCSLTVNNKTVFEEESKSIIFDSTHTHSAENNSNQNRVILYIDFSIIK